MSRARAAIQMALGGAVCGTFLGIFIGGLLGSLAGLWLGRAMGLDGALLGGGISFVAGACYGVILAARGGLENSLADPERSAAFASPLRVETSLGTEERRPVR